MLYLKRRGRDIYQRTLTGWVLNRTFSTFVEAKNYMASKAVA